MINHNALRRTSLPLAVIAAGLALSACGGRSSADKPPATATVQAKKHKPAPFRLTKANMELPLYPEGVDYDHAGMVAANLDGFDFQDAQQELAKIKDPHIRAKAAHLIEATHAEAAANDAVDFGLEDAKQELKLVHDPKLRAEVGQIIDDYRFVVAADDELTYSGPAEVRADGRLINSLGLRRRLEEVIKAEQSGHETKAYNLEQAVEDRAYKLDDRITHQADRENDVLWRHTTYYHKQYEKAPDS